MTQTPGNLSPKRTIGMTIIAIISILFGGIIAVGNTLEVIRGRTFDGLEVNSTPIALLGLAGAVFAALLLAGGVGSWLVKPFGRRLSLLASAGTLLLNAVATVIYRFPFERFVIGAVYPVVLLFVFRLPSWKKAFVPFDDMSKK
ncbi:hypothetical protein KFU94_39840 [Chloroflexi bacterium TSY]|nr:hypothetical protein [Chloroflexi bacterium TSY]